MADMIVTGAFALAGFILGSFVALAGFVAGRSQKGKDD